MISVGQRKGAAKDTLRNALETREFVVNIVSEDLAEAMNLTSGDYDYTVNEFDLARLAPAPSLEVKRSARRGCRRGAGVPRHPDRSSGRHHRYHDLGSHRLLSHPR